MKSTYFVIGEKNIVFLLYFVRRNSIASIQIGMTLAIETFQKVKQDSILLALAAIQSNLDLKVGRCECKTQIFIRLTLIEWNPFIRF